MIYKAENWYAQSHEQYFSEHRFLDMFQCAFIITFDYIDYFSSSFNVWSKDLYSKWKFRLSSFDILPLIAFKLEQFLYFEIAASIGSKRFRLKPFFFS